MPPQTISLDSTFCRGNRTQPHPCVVATHCFASSVFLVAASGLGTVRRIKEITYKAGKGRPRGAAVSVLPACSQPRSGPAWWNPACRECSKNVVGFCVKCCHCCSFVPWLPSLKSHLGEPHARRPPPSLAILGRAGGLSRRPGPSRHRTAASWVTRSPASWAADVTSLFSRSPY